MEGLKLTTFWTGPVFLQQEDIEQTVEEVAQVNEGRSDSQMVFINYFPGNVVKEVVFCN